MKRKATHSTSPKRRTPRDEPSEPENLEWLNLPEDLWTRILRCLYPDQSRELVLAMCTCKTLHRLGTQVLENIEVCDRHYQSDDDMTEVFMWLLKKSPKLAVLKTMATGTITAFPRQLPCMEKLTFLELHELHITYEALRSVFYNSAEHRHNLPNLATLNLTSLRLLGRPKCKWLRPLEVPCLTSLTITWCTDLTVDSVVDIAFRLQKLSLHGCDSIGDQITGRLYNVRDLDMAFTKISDKGLNVLHYGCPSLKHLILSYSQSNMWTSAVWTATGITDFQKKRPDISVVFAHC